MGSRKVGDDLLLRKPLGGQITSRIVCKQLHFYRIVHVIVDDQCRILAYAFARTEFIVIAVRMLKACGCIHADSLRLVLVFLTYQRTCRVCVGAALCVGGAGFELRHVTVFQNSVLVHAIPAVLLPISAPVRPQVVQFFFEGGVVSIQRQPVSDKTGRQCEHGIRRVRDKGHVKLVSGGFSFGPFVVRGSLIFSVPRDRRVRLRLRVPSTLQVKRVELVHVRPVGLCVANQVCVAEPGAVLRHVAQSYRVDGPLAIRIC